MADQPVLLAFNRGVISKLGLARTDLNRTALSAAVQTNFVPRKLGPMMLRPGLEYITSTKGNAKSKGVPFIYANDDTAKIELSDQSMRVLVDEVVVSREAVSTVFVNGSFDADIFSWASLDENGGKSEWVEGGYLGLTGNGTSAAISEQELTVAANDQNKEHALDIVVERGPVTLTVGAVSGGNDYIDEKTLRTGVHSWAFTPTSGSVFVRFSNDLERQVLVDSVAIATAGDMVLAAPWKEKDLYNVRTTQSGDVIFVACDGYQQRRIERHQGLGKTSWSVVLYQAFDGPYLIENVGPTTISASALTGNVTLTASKGIFKPGHKGALFSITSDGQRVEADVSDENNYTDIIEVSGTSSSRQFSIEISGEWTGTVTLQRSIGDEVSWEDVSAKTWTENTTETYNDGLDNQIVYYRLGIKSGNYTDGTAEIALDYAIGSIRGVARVTKYVSPTSVEAEVIKNLGGTEATDTWMEGAWSEYQGWPSCTALDEGRLWWFGSDKVWGSVSDAFDSFDPDVEGDSGSISRSIGEGPVDTIHWALPLLRLVFGAGGGAYVVKASSLDEPLTPTDFNIKSPDSNGCAQVVAVKIDSACIYVEKSGVRVYELVPDGSYLDYAPSELTAIVPEIGEPGIITVGVQRTPDTRVHCVRTDGKVALLVHDPAEDVRAWLPIETPGGKGKVEDVLVLPGTEEDKVYYLVKRTIDGVTVRNWERWALERHCRGETYTHDGKAETVLDGLPYRDGTVVTARDADGAKIENLTVSENAVILSAGISYCTLTPAVLKLGDSCMTYSGATTSTMSGLDHLEGEDVVVFADGIALRGVDGELAQFTVANGSVALTHEGETYSAEQIMVGLPYTARFKSSKLAYAAQVGTALSQSGKVSRVGLILVDTHAKGIKFGQSFDDLQEMPNIEEGAVVDPDYLWPEYDKSTMPFPSSWGVDSRICLEASAPRPATVAAIPFVIEKHSRV